APDRRQGIVASARDRESALAAAERLAAPLETLVEQGAIGGFDSAARYLPPLAVQRARQASLPPPTEIGARLREALSGAPVSASRLEPFVLDVERARSAPPLTRADLEGTSFAAAVDALLVRSADGWSALLPLAAVGSGDLKPGAVAQVRAALAGEPRVHTVLLDLKAEADRLYSSYLTEAARLALAGLGAIVLLLVAVLACSRVPVLAELGSTVAPGTLLALVFSAQLSRPQRPAAAALVSAR